MGFVGSLPELARVGAEKGLLKKRDFSVIDRSQLMNFDGYSAPEVIFRAHPRYDKKLPVVPSS